MSSGYGSTYDAKLERQLEQAQAQGESEMTEITVVPASAAMLHVVVGGVSHDVEQGSIDIGSASTDREIKEKAADYFNVPLVKLDNHDVVRNPQTGNITLHPRAVFG